MSPAEFVTLPVNVAVGLDQIWQHTPPIPIRATEKERARVKRLIVETHSNLIGNRLSMHTAAPICIKLERKDERSQQKDGGRH